MKRIVKEDVEDFPRELTKQLQDYVSNYLPGGICAVFDQRQTDLEMDLKFCIVNECFRLSNFW